MSAQAELIRLGDRKQELLARSEAGRAGVREAWADFRFARRQWGGRLSRLWEPKMLLLVGAAVTGAVVAGRRSRRLGLVAKIAALWRLYGIVKPLWRGYRVARALRR